MNPIDFGDPLYSYRMTFLVLREMSDRLPSLTKNFTSSSIVKILMMSLLFFKI